MSMTYFATLMTDLSVEEVQTLVASLPLVMRSPEGVLYAQGIHQIAAQQHWEGPRNISSVKIDIGMTISATVESASGGLLGFENTVAIIDSLLRAVPNDLFLCDLDCDDIILRRHNGCIEINSSIPWIGTIKPLISHPFVERELGYTFKTS